MSPPGRRGFLATAAGAAALGIPALAADTTDLPGKTPHTRFAVNVEMWWRKLPFTDRLIQAAELGYSAVEFWPWENKDLAAVARIAQAHKIEIAQFTAWGFRPGLNDPANREMFLRKIEAGCKVARDLNCKKMTVVGGDDVPGLTQAQMHQNIIDGLRAAAPIAEKHEIMLILEPMNIRVDHKGHCLHGSEPAVKICRAVASRFVKINWDLYHMQISEGDLCGHLKEGYDQVGYIQIADHPGRNEPGTGEIHYTRVFQHLAELGYRDYVGLELRPRTDEMTAARAVWAPTSGDAMARAFLTARWQNLCLLNYPVPPELLRPRLPPGLELDAWEGQPYVSLVAFDFLDTRVLGIGWPGYRDFAEINLRYYVRRGDERGVVFIREIVPHRLTAWLARTLYNEPYRTAPLTSHPVASPGRLTAEYRLTWQGRAYTVAVTGTRPGQPYPAGSMEAFFKEHQWGFGTSCAGRLIRYEVAHPEWQCYPVQEYHLHWDWAHIYGPEWGFLNGCSPRSIILAAGSAVTVYSRGQPTP